MANATSLPSALSGLRAFVVEDETLVAIFLEDLLEELGCTVVGSAGQVPRALCLIEALQPDIAVIDINLAGEEAYPIASALCRQRIPFIFATGYGDGRVHPDWRHCPVIQKPYHKTDLQRAMTQALASSINA